MFDKYDIIDKSVHNKNRILFSPRNRIKKDEEVPSLDMVEEYIFENRAAYIKEDNIDLDLQININKQKNKSLRR